MYEAILILRGGPRKTLPNGDVGHAPIAWSRETRLGPAPRRTFFLRSLQFIRGRRAVFTSGSVGVILQRMSTSLPVIDLRLAAEGADARLVLARQLDLACTDFV